MPPLIQVCHRVQVPVVHLTRLLAGAPAEIFDAARDLDVLAVDRLTSAGLTRGLLDTGDLVVVRRRYGAAQLRVVVAERPSLLVVRGDRVRLRLRLAATGAGTLVTAELAYRALRRSTAFRLLNWLLDRMRPRPRPVLVVGAAILTDAGLLAARRNEPAGWELPGGKVEPGERPEDALVRECCEELGIEIELGERVGVDIPLGGAARLRVWTAGIASGVPVPIEHLELRWVGAADLDSLGWLPADRALIPHLRRALANR